MKYIRIAVCLGLAQLLVSPVSAAAPTITEQTLQSKQQLIGMREALGLDENHSFQLQSVEQDALGQTHIRFRQFYHGVRIWGGEAITHRQAKGEELPPTSALKQAIRVDIEPKLTAADALAVAKANLATRFEFANPPTTELVIYPETVSRELPRQALVDKNRLNAEDFVTEIKGYQLAYHVHTEIEKPGDTRHTDYLVNAHTGQIIEQWDSLQSAETLGDGNSQYSGVVSLNTNGIGAGHELRDLTRPLGGGNVVYNLDHKTEGTGAIYVDSDNTWGDGGNFKEDPEPTTSANGQTAAVDAAFGLQATWDMYKNVFGRNGIDGPWQSNLCARALRFCLRQCLLFGLLQVHHLRRWHQTADADLARCRGPRIFARRLFDHGGPHLQ